MEIKLGKKKPILIFLSFVLVCFLLIFFVVVPMVKKIYQQKDLLEETKLTFKRDQENIDKYKNDLKYLQENSILSEGLEINENNRVKIIEDLERISVEEGLELKIETSATVITGKKNVGKEATEETVLKLVLTGEYKNFLVFLYKLQNFKYMINIDKLSVAKFDEAKIKNYGQELILENLPEIEGEIIISFNEQKK